MLQELKTKDKPYFYDMYVALQSIGYTPTLIATYLNNDGKKRKTNSPYNANTITLAANGHQNDDNVEKIILRLHSQHFRKNP